MTPSHLSFLSRGTHWLPHSKAALTCLSNSGLVPVVGTSAKMRTLVPKISFSNCAETKLTNACLVQEEGEKGSPKEPRPVKRPMCCLGLGEEGKKWSNEKILEATDTSPVLPSWSLRVYCIAPAALSLSEGRGGTVVRWKRVEVVKSQPPRLKSPLLYWVSLGK